MDSLPVNDRIEESLSCNVRIRAAEQCTSKTLSENNCQPKILYQPEIPSRTRLLDNRHFQINKSETMCPHEIRLQEILKDVLQAESNLKQKFRDAERNEV